MMVLSSFTTTARLVILFFSLACTNRQNTGIDAIMWLYTLWKPFMDTPIPDNPVSMTLPCERPQNSACCHCISGEIHFNTAKHRTALATVQPSVTHIS